MTLRVILDDAPADLERSVIQLRGVSLRDARRIAGVACDPAFLVRDLAYFADEGYRPVWLCVFDLLPFTHHVECVAILGPAAEQV